MIGSTVKPAQTEQSGNRQCWFPLSTLGKESMLIQCLNNIPTYVTVGKDKMMVFTMFGETEITVKM